MDENIKSFDDWYFEEKYGKYGVKTRYEYHYFIKPLISEYGISMIDSKMLKKTKGKGSHGEGHGKGKNNKKIPFDPPRYDVENLFKPDYDLIFSYEKDRKFRKLYKLVFNHVFYNPESKKLYEHFHERYNNDIKNGNIDRINDICQRISRYIRDNGLSENQRFIDGSFICNIAVIISEYMKTGKINTDIKRINNMNVDTLNNDDNIYYLFLLSQIFTTKYHYKKMFFKGRYIRDWWAICMIRRRITDKDFKSKGILPRFVIDENKNISFELY